MFPLDYVLAVALLSTAPDNVEAAEAHACYANVRPTLQALALQWELLDTREVRDVMSRPEEFAADLKLLRRRYADYHDAPPLHDCMRLPDRNLVNDLLALNRAYRQHVENQQAVEFVRAWDLRETIVETDRLYHVWDTVRDARCDYYYITIRRQALKKLREAVGDQAYYSGALPPPVPVWRFSQID